MSEVEYIINHNLDGWPICKNGEPIFDNKTMLAELHSFQARIKELEAAHTAALKTYTACSNERERLRAENAELVEALEKIDAMPHYDYPLRFGCNKSLHDRYELMLQTASEALAAYRKQGGAQQ